MTVYNDRAAWNQPGGFSLRIRSGIPSGMSDLTQFLGSIEAGDSKAAEHLFPLVYEELRKLAAAKMAQEKAGQTLQATALVHEASAAAFRRVD